jgi:uncharacterized membrane protein YphA (DoxX/SURF4 family)
MSLPLAQRVANLTPILAPLGATVGALGGLVIVLGLAASWAKLLMIAFTLVCKRIRTMATYHPQGGGR